MSGIVGGFFQSLGQDWLQDKANEYAEEHFQPTKDPYYEELPNGKRVKRRLPDYCSKQESKAYKKLQNQAWSHDKGICGSCCWSQCIGWAPMLSILPIIGPAIMYSIHGKMVDRVKVQFDLPKELVVKMHANIGIDLAIALVPVLGIIFSWMNACSTRNCAMVYNFVSQRAVDAKNQKMREKAGIAETKRNEKIAHAEAKQNAKLDKKYSKSHSPSAAAMVAPVSAPAAMSNQKSSKYAANGMYSTSTPTTRNIPFTASPFDRPPAPVPAAPQPAASTRGDPYTASVTRQSYPMQDWSQVQYSRPSMPPPYPDTTGSTGFSSRAGNPYV